MDRVENTCNVIGPKGPLIAATSYLRDLGLYLRIKSNTFAHVKTLHLRRMFSFIVAEFPVYIYARFGRMGHLFR